MTHDEFVAGVDAVGTYLRQADIPDVIPMVGELLNEAWNKGYWRGYQKGSGYHSN